MSIRRRLILVPKDLFWKNSKGLEERLFYLKESGNLRKEITFQLELDRSAKEKVSSKLSN